MSARILLPSLLLSFTLLLSLTLAQSSTIFIDYTNGFSTVLLNPPSLSIQDLHPYDGGHPGSFRFFVLWRDVSDCRSNAVSIFFTNTAVLGDPQFVGLRGQSYQVHGMDGAIYNLISDKNLQVNSRFVFLTEGQCPIIDGVVDTNCWSHPGSYIGEMSFQQVVDGKLHGADVAAVVLMCARAAPLYTGAARP